MKRSILTALSVLAVLGGVLIFAGDGSTGPETVPSELASNEPETTVGSTEPPTKIAIELDDESELELLSLGGVESTPVTCIQCTTCVGCPLCSPCGDNGQCTNGYCGGNVGCWRFIQSC